MKATGQRINLSAYDPKFLSKILSKLSEKEDKVLRLRNGIGDGYPRTLEEISQIFNLSAATITRIFHEANRKLIKIISETTNLEEIPAVAVFSLIESAKALTPYVISHLKKHENDLRRIPWQIFEHLIAEFFAGMGYQDVCVVGRNAETAGDIVALNKPDKLGVVVRYVIEVKRQKNKVGVEVIDRILGAVSSERPKFGYHVAMVVSLAGFKDMKKYTPLGLSLLGIELRDGSHIQKWLREYQFNRKGLWLPNPYQNNQRIGGVTVGAGLV